MKKSLPRFLVCFFAVILSGCAGQPAVKETSVATHVNTLAAEATKTPAPAPATAMLSPVPSQTATVIPTLVVNTPVPTPYPIPESFSFQQEAGLRLFYQRGVSLVALDAAGETVLQKRGEDFQVSGDGLWYSYRQGLELWLGGTDGSEPALLLRFNAFSPPGWESEPLVCMDVEQRWLAKGSLLVVHCPYRPPTSQKLLSHLYWVYDPSAERMVCSFDSGTVGKNVQFAETKDRQVIFLKGWGEEGLGALLDLANCTAFKRPVQVFQPKPMVYRIPEQIVHLSLDRVFFYWSVETFDNNNYLIKAATASGAYQAFKMQADGKYPEPYDPLNMMMLNYPDDLQIGADQRLVPYYYLKDLDGLRDWIYRVRASNNGYRLFSPPEGYDFAVDQGEVIAPDGKSALVVDLEGKYALAPLGKGEAIPLPAGKPLLLGWSESGRAVLQIGAQSWFVELKKELQPFAPTGLQAVDRLQWLDNDRLVYRGILNGEPGFYYQKVGGKPARLYDATGRDINLLQVINQVSE